jgi:hypothetical protein
VYYPNAASAAKQVDEGKAAQTKLTEFFTLNVDDVVEADRWQARTLLYEDLPTYFWWDKADKRWLPQKSCADAVGCLFLVSYLAGESFYLRVLLLNRRDMRSHNDLRHVDGVQHVTFQDAGNALGLLVNDYLYNQTLTEAAMIQPGFKVCQLFDMMCAHTPPLDPRALFETHFEAFTDDTSRVNMRDRHSQLFLSKEQKLLALCRLETILKDMDKSLEGCGLKPTKAKAEALKILSFGIEGKESCNAIAERLKANVKRLNKGQSAFFGAVKASVLDTIGAMFYLDGPGGTGKTFLLNALIDLADTEKVNQIVVASTGVAALLLKDGQTAHSTFKIPIPCDFGSNCPIDRSLPLGQMLINSRLIIWDEIVTVHKYVISAVNRTLQDLAGNPLPFGGKTVVFSGDFCQILPVVKYNEYPDSLNPTIKSTAFWGSIIEYKLTKNMPLASALAGPYGQKNEKFVAALLKLGEGRRQTDDFALTRLRHVSIASTQNLAKSNKALCEFVYEDLLDRFHEGPGPNGDYLYKRCILAPLNKDVRVLNDMIVEKLPGATFVSKSINYPDPDGCNSLPEECLNKLSMSGLPEHLLRLIKVGMPIVITRNLYVNKGVCNGSQMVITELGDGFLVGRLLAGAFSGNEVMIPKIKHHHKGSKESALSFFQYQFPLCPAYAMSVNKSQGQTLKRVGVLLKTDVFAHGQLYVALSRVSDCQNLLVVKLRGQDKVVNVVHRLIFEV